MPVVHSAYRAWCEGIGNSPSQSSQSIGAGDQYLAMDPEPWHEPDLPEQLSQWLTLNVPESRYEVVGDRLEGWMAAPIAGWQFVGRLTTFGRDRYGRPSYFAHGRGWRDATWSDVKSDPGVWMGDASAFDAPRLTRETQTPSRPPELADRLAAAGQLLTDPRLSGVTVRLLAWLYRAVDTNTTVIVAAPIEAFFAGQPLPSLVAIARAALPIEVRRRAKIRIYADSPGMLLDDGVHLLALASDKAGVAAKYGSVVLQVHENGISGPQLPKIYEEYAAATLERARSYPRRLLHFSATASRTLYSAMKGETPMAVSTTIAYDVVAAAAFARGFDSLLLKRLFPEAAQRIGDERQPRVQPRPLAWDELCLHFDWNALSEETILQIALKPAPTPDSAALLRRVRETVSARGIRLDDALRRHWTPSAGGARDLVDWFRGSGSRSVAPGTIVALLQRLTAADVREVLMDVQFGPTFAQWAAKEPLPEAWLASALEVAPAPDAERMLMTVASGAIGSERVASNWRNLIDRWVVTLARSGQVSRNVSETVATLGAHLPSLDVAIAYGDILANHPSAHTYTHGLVSALRGSTLSASDRRMLVSRCREGSSVFLQQHLPFKWLLEHVEPADLVELTPYIDRRMAIDLAETARALIEKGSWAIWAHASTASDRRFQAACEWLGARAPADPSLDWPEVLRALKGRLSGEAIEQIWRRAAKDASMHRLSTAQRLELAGCAADLTAVAVVAELQSPPDYRAAERLAREQTSLLSGLPSGVLHAIGRSARTIPSLNVPQVEWLLARGGARGDRALPACIDQLLSDAANGVLTESHPDAALWRHPEVPRAVQSWLHLHWGELGDRRTALRAWLPPLLTTRFPSHDRSSAPGRPAAESALSAHAPIVMPEHAALNALCTGSTDDGPWAALLQQCARAHPRAPHPIATLADLVARLDRAEFNRLHRHATSVLRLAIERYPALADVPRGYRSELPIFTLLLRAQPDAMLHEVAMCILEWRALSSFYPNDEWYTCLLRAIREATRASGVRGADDSPDVAVTRVVADMTRRGFPNHVRAGVLAHVNPLHAAFRCGAGTLWTP